MATELQAAVKPELFVVLAQIAAGAAGGPWLTPTVTVCVATPELLLAVKVKVRVPRSACGGM